MSNSNVLHGGCLLSAAAPASVTASLLLGDKRTAAFIVENRRIGQTPGMGNRPAQQRFFSFLPLSMSCSLFAIYVYSNLEISQECHRPSSFRQNNRSECYKAVTFENREQFRPRFSKKIQFCRSRSMMLTLAICRYKSAGIATVRRIRKG